MESALKRKETQWLRTVGCQCGAISLHLTIYLMDFQQFQRIIFVIFNEKNIERLGGRVPLRAISFICYDISSLIFF